MILVYRMNKTNVPCITPLLGFSLWVLPSFSLNLEPFWLMLLSGGVCTIPESDDDEAWKTNKMKVLNTFYFALYVYV